MIAVYVNMITVLFGSLIGIVFGRKIKDSYIKTIMTSLGIIVGVIGISSAIVSKDTLCLVICLILGSIIGEAIKLDDRLEGMGDYVKKKFLSKIKVNERFTEGFVSAGLLFCIGSMSIMGSLEAGINNNYTIIFTKSIMDFFSSMMLATTMGIGVTFSILFVLLFQGSITLLANVVAPYLGEAVIVEMSAIGGAILIGMAINMLEISKTRIKIANMLPAILLPIVYIPLVEALKQLF